MLDQITVHHPDQTTTTLAPDREAIAEVLADAGLADRAVIRSKATEIHGALAWGRSRFVTASLPSGLVTFERHVAEALEVAPSPAPLPLLRSLRQRLNAGLRRVVARFHREQLADGADRPAA